MSLALNHNRQAVDDATAARALNTPRING